MRVKRGQHISLMMITMSGDDNKVDNRFKKIAKIDGQLDGRKKHNIIRDTK